MCTIFSRSFDGSNSKEMGRFVETSVGSPSLSTDLPERQGLLNSWVREEAIAVAEPCNTPLEIPSGPEDICLRMEDNRWKTLSSEQEISETSGGGEFSIGGSKGVTF